MRAIAFVTQKGGSGKSTLACSLAVAAKDAGERVCVIDMDPQASLVSWSKTRERDDIAVVAANGEELPALLGALEKKGITLAIIDTPGADGGGFGGGDACGRSQCHSLPPEHLRSMGERADVRRLEGDRTAISSFMLNQCPPVSTIGAGRKTPSRRSRRLAVLITPLVAARVDFQDAARHGLGVTELTRTAVPRRKYARCGSRSNAVSRAARPSRRASEAA